MSAARRFVRSCFTLAAALVVGASAHASRPVDSGCPPCDSPRPTAARTVIGVRSTSASSEVARPAAPATPRTTAVKPANPRTLARAKRQARPLPATPGMGSLLRASSGIGVELS